MSESTQPPLGGMSSRLPGMAYQCRVTKAWPMLWMSEACETITGWAPAEFISERVNYGDLIEPAFRDAVWEAVQVAMEKDEPFQVTYTIKRRDGRIRWMWEQGYALKERLDGDVVLEGLICDVSPQQARLAEIESAQKFSERVAATVPGHIFLMDMSNQSIVYSNRHYANLPQIESRDGRGGLAVDYFRSRLHRDHTAEAEQWWRSCLELRDGQVVEWSYSLLDDSGQWMERSMRSTPFERDADGKVKQILCVAMDETEAVRVSAKLRDSKQRYQTIMDAAKDGIFVCDRGLQFVEVNPAGCDLLRMTREEVIGTNLLDLFDAEELEARPLDPRSVSEWASQLTERKVWLGDGSWAYVELHGRLLPDGSLVGVARDVTARRREHERHLQFEKQVSESQRLALQGTLSRGIAHDFNNLLATILSSSETLLEGETLSVEAREKVDRVRLAATRASDLTRRLLDATGSGDHEVVDVDIAALIGEMPELISPFLKRNIQLRLDLAPDLRAVRGDPSRLRQVVMNLLINATEAVDAQTGVVSVSAQQISVDDEALLAALPDADKQGDYIRIEVSDNGCGVAEERQATIFEPYVSTKGAGRGLGLAAVKGIVKQHGGNLELTSSVGEGTCCVVWLPASARRTRRFHSGVWRNPWRGAGKVLLVDDEQAPRQALHELITAIGFDVDAVAGGQEALDLLEQRADEFATVLLDVSMPGIDGVETWRRIAARWKSLPVLLMSGMSPPELGELPEGLQAPAFLLKPFTMHQLRKELQSATLAHAMSAMEQRRSGSSLEP